VLCAALRPALPVFVCLGMDGARLAHPCCASDDEQDELAAPDGVEHSRRAWAPLCCRPELPPTLHSSRPPSEPQRSLPTVWSALLLAAPAPPPATVSARAAPPRRDEPPVVGPAPPLRALLRI
jgi:hypothetical protein